MGKFGDADHFENFSEVIRSAGKSHDLAVAVPLGQKLNQHGNPPAINISVFINLYQDSGIIMPVAFLKGLAQERFGRRREISMDVKKGHGAVLLHNDMIDTLSHGNPLLPLLSFIFQEDSIVFGCYA
jgi:hypothetical protein